MRFNFIPWIIAFSLTSCVHKQQSDDLMEMTEFSQKSESPVDTSVTPGEPDNKVQRDESGQIVEEPVLTREKLRALHMLLHRYAKKVNLEKRAQPAELGFQHEEIIQTLAGLEDTERTSLVKSVLTLAVIEKSVYSFLQAKDPSLATTYRTQPVQEEASEAADSPESESKAEDPMTEKPVELFEGAVESEEIDNLDILVNNFDVNIADTLRKNRLLAFPYIHNFILISLDNMIVSDGLKEDIIESIKDVSTPWVEIYKTIAPEEFKTISSASNEEESSAEPAEKTIKPAITFLAGDFADGEDHLNKAKKLANKHQYSEAISILETINEDSPYFNTKKEMIKKYSNLAVKSLRRKAAQSFQSAIPAPSLDAKLNYLKEAETHLKDAIEEYPEADQLEKVKENLSIIQKRINVIEAQIDSEL